MIMYINHRLIIRVPVKCGIRTNHEINLMLYMSLM